MAHAQKKGVSHVARIDANAAHLRDQLLNHVSAYDLRRALEMMTRSEFALIRRIFDDAGRTHADATPC